MESSQPCKLKISKKIDSKAPAFLATFTNGRLRTNKETSISFQCYRTVQDVNTQGSARRMLVAESDRLRYIAKSPPMDIEQKSPVRYFIGVRKKGASKMKLYDSALFSLKPVLNNNFQLSVPTQDRSYKESIDQLTANFGSKGKKRAMMARLKYTVDTSLSEALEDVPLDNSVLNTTNENTPLASSSSIDYIPPQNQSASSEAEVYDIADIITPEEWEYLNSEAESLVDATDEDIDKWSKSNTYCSYVILHLKSQKVDHDKAAYLLYYNYLSSLYKLKYAEVRRKDPIPSIPEPFKSKLLKLFTLVSVNESKRITRTMPQKMKDKVLAYIIVLALFIDDFCVNLALIQSDVNAAATKVVAVAQAVGCHISTKRAQDSAIKFAELKLPLFVLAPKHSKRKF